MTNIQRVDDGVHTHVECAEGVSIERRALLWLPVAFAGGHVLHASPVRAGAAVPEGEDALSPLLFEDFSPRWVALARAARGASREADESYAAQLAGLVARVPPEALPRLGEGRSQDGLEGGPSWFLAPCVMVEFRMQPGAKLRPHNHPPQVVLTLVLEGEARYEHHEIEGNAPPCTKIDGSEFRVRQTRAGFLKPGCSTSLTRMRDGIHGFTAGKEGASLVDFTITFGDDVETFSYVKLSAEPVDAERRVFGAVWTGKV